MEQDFRHLDVQFYMDRRQNLRKTREQRRPIYDDVEMVKIRMAGDPKNVFHAPAHSGSAVRDPQTNLRLTYAELHPEPYAAFKRNEEWRGSGTPLDVAPFISKAKEAELHALNVFTLEQLAGLDGANLQRLGMGGRDLKDKATEYLDAAKGLSDASHLAAENETLKARLEKLEAMLLNDASNEHSSDSEPETTAAPTPFDDWDMDTIKAWIEDQGGRFDGRWSVERAREEAAKLNDRLAQEAA